MKISDLSAKRCSPCTSNSHRLSKKELGDYIDLLPSWRLKEERLEREVKVKDFSEALNLANRIGALAEQENHHPDLLVRWGLLGISLYTHSVQGLTENDFILAAKIDELIPLPS